MGMFDYIRVAASLLPPGTPVLEWQTKDTDAQYCDLYELREDGTLWHETYDIEDRSDPNAEGLMALAGCMTRINERWEADAMTGEIRFYGHEGRDYEKWWELSAYLIGGKVQSMTLLARPASRTSEARKALAATDEQHGGSEA